MGLVEQLLGVARAFEGGRIPFMLVGGMAVSTWVEPRLTRDLDIVVVARRKDSPRLKQILVSAGARAAPLEMRLLFERRFVRLKTQGAKLDVHVSSCQHDRAAFQRSQKISYGGLAIRVATPEDLILYKLQAWRLQDQDDIVRLLRQTRGLDISYIQGWLGQIEENTGFPMQERWTTVQKMVTVQSSN